MQIFMKSADAYLRTNRIVGQSRLLCCSAGHGRRESIGHWLFCRAYTIHVHFVSVDNLVLPTKNKR